jgi:N,N'-diacetyllegionaminate synthase
MNNVKIIAEVANSHCGDYENIISLIKNIENFDFDYIKFQLYRANQLVTKDHPRLSSYLRKQFSDPQWLKISQYCNDLNFNIIAEVFDYESFKLSLKMNIKGYKIHSTSVNDINLLKNIAKTNKMILLSLGGSTKEEIKQSIKIIKDSGKSKIVLMNGIQLFPTGLEDTNLNLINTLKSEFCQLNKSFDFGLQDHIKPSDKMSFIAPCVAVHMGYTYIEKHITLSRKLTEDGNSNDYHSSLEPNEFNDFIKCIRNLPLLLGKKSFDITENELKYRNSMKKFIVAKHDIKDNSHVCREDFLFKRTKEMKGLLPTKITDIIGLKAKKSIKSDETIDMDMFYNEI